jgi:hypothetical protein
VLSAAHFCKFNNLKQGEYMVAPPQFYSLNDALAVMREVHEENTKAFYSLRRGPYEHFTAATFLSDRSKNLAYWKRFGFEVTDGPFDTLAQAKREAQLMGAYSRSERQRHGLLGR